jgi:hypothetical protein
MSKIDLHIRAANRREGDEQVPVKVAVGQQPAARSGVAAYGPAVAPGEVVLGPVMKWLKTVELENFIQRSRCGGKVPV